MTFPTKRVSVLMMVTAGFLSYILVSDPATASETANQSASGAVKFIPVKTAEPAVLDGNLDDKVSLTTV